MKILSNILIIIGFICIGIAMDLMGYSSNSIESWLVRIAMMSLCIALFIRCKN